MCCALQQRSLLPIPPVHVPLYRHGVISAHDSRLESGETSLIFGRTANKRNCSALCLLCEFRYCYGSDSHSFAFYCCYFGFFPSVHWGFPVGCVNTIRCLTSGFVQRQNGNNTHQEHANVCLLCFGVPYQHPPVFGRSLIYRHSYNGTSLWLWLHKVGIIQPNAYVRCAKIYLLRVALCFTCTELYSLALYLALATSVLLLLMPPPPPPPLLLLLLLPYSHRPYSILCYAHCNRTVLCIIPRTERNSKVSK